MENLKRIHGPDNVRGLMMILGVVFHSSLFYMTMPEKFDWPLSDPNGSHQIFDLLIFFIHCFRVPVFFVIGGYFGALLIERKGIRSFVHNRFKRIGIPLLGGLTTIVPILGLLIVLFLKAINHPLIENPPSYIFYKAPIFFHLWFLYFLVLFYIASIFLHYLSTKFLFFKIFTPKLKKYFFFPWGLIGCFLVTIPLFSLFTRGHVGTSLTLLPELRTFVYYGMFFFLGRLLYKEPQIIQSYSKHWSLCLFFGVCSFILYFQEVANHLESVVLPFEIMLTGPIAIWSLVWGILGFTFNWKGGTHFTLSYLSEASYWIYLIHLPLVFLFGGILMWVEAGTYVKGFSLMGLTLLTSILTYHFFIRASLIGEILNGRRRSGRLNLPFKKIGLKLGISRY